MSCDQQRGVLETCPIPVEKKIQRCGRSDWRVIVHAVTVLITVWVERSFFYVPPPMCCIQQPEEKQKDGEAHKDEHDEGQEEVSVAVK